MTGSSVRFRLTAWYAIVALVSMAVVSVSVYIFVRNRIETSARDKLDDGFATVEAVIHNSGGDLFDVAHLGHGSMFLITREEEILYRTRAWEEAGINEARQRGTADRYRSWRSPDGRLYQLRSASLPDYGFELVFAHEISAIEDSLGSLALILLAIFPAAVILAVIGGYVLAGRALAPVNAITAKARRITVKNLSERLPVPNPDDEIGRLTTVFNDTLARFEQSFAKLRRFTADASHELRTPLTSIRSVSEVTLRGPADVESYREAIGSMLEETERLTRLVDNLLVLARGDTGKVLFEKRAIDLHGLVTEMVDVLRVLAEEREQTLSVIGPSPVSVSVDPSTLHLALTNVVHNAILYTPSGGRIDIVLASDVGEATIDIIDEGPGIPIGEREKIFERFYRMNGARSRADGGAGLGLSIARRAVEANGGSISFRDRDGPGICCRITLPLCPIGDG